MCDTVVDPLPGGGWLFAKNSDREANEAQAVEYHPPAEHPLEASVRCTYVTIPQTRRTRGVILSRPFWMWGAEMGVNEAGVAIGNEAVWTKEPLNKEDGLTGMDLLRLALERADTASEALQVIVDLLEQHGQGGICGYQDTSMTYHNSFLIVDPVQAWVLETAGEYWAAKSLTDSYAISNGLTLGSDLDRTHPALEERAADRGYLRSGETFHFTKAYADFLYTTFSACRTRQASSGARISDRAAYDDPRRRAFATLRDHGKRHPLVGLRGTQVCAHAANGLTRNASQTTASLVAVLRPNLPPEIWVTGTAAPCTGVFKPVGFGEAAPQFGIPGATPDESLWWRHERYHRAVNADFAGRLGVNKAERDALEAEFLENYPGPDAPGLASYARNCFERANAELDRWRDALNLCPKASPTRYWKKLNRAVGIRV